MENRQKLKRPIQRKTRFSKEKNELTNRKIEESFFPNFQDFALHLLIRGEIHHVNYFELNRLATKVHKIDINVNQMAHLANQFHEVSSEGIKGLTDKIQGLNALIQSELNKLIRRRE